MVKVLVVLEQGGDVQEIMQDLVCKFINCLIYVLIKFFQQVVCDGDDECLYILCNSFGLEQCIFFLFLGQGEFMFMKFFIVVKLEVLYECYEEVQVLFGDVVMIVDQDKFCVLLWEYV